VIRVWTPGDEVETHRLDGGRFCGVVQQVGAGDAAPFRNESELLDVLRRTPREHAASEARKGEGNVH
jgi:hypothetical protein